MGEWPANARCVSRNEKGREHLEGDRRVVLASRLQMIIQLQMSDVMHRCGSGWGDLVSKTGSHRVDKAHMSHVDTPICITAQK